MIIYDWGPLKKICPTESFILYQVAIYLFRTFIGYVWLEKALPELFWKMAARGRMVENISKNKIFLCSYEPGRDFVYSEFFFRSCKKRCRSPQNRRFWVGEIGAAPLRVWRSILDWFWRFGTLSFFGPLKADRKNPRRQSFFFVPEFFYFEKKFR